MCRSCVYPNYRGLYCQQCSKCGHPSHYPGVCGVGVTRFMPLAYNSKYDQEGISFGCECIDD